MITNLMNLPEPFVKACEKSEYESKPNYYGATTLLKSNAEIILSRRYHSQIVQDASEMVWAIFGSAVHKVLEESGNDETSEVYVCIQITDKSYFHGYIDLVEDGITDFKTCSVYKVKKKDYKKWRKQLLEYSWAYWKKTGIKKYTARIIAIIKDYREGEKFSDPEYPNLPVITIDFNFTDDDYVEIENFIRNKIISLENDLDKPDNELITCSDEERWHKQDAYIVWKEGNKKGTQAFYNKEDAEIFISQQKKPELYYIVPKKGEDTKCQRYCRVAEFCPFRIITNNE